MEKLILGNLTQRKIGYGIVQPGNNIYSGVHVIKVYNIIAGLSKLSDLDLTATEIEEKYSRTRLKGGELIVSIVGTIGKTAIVPKEFAGCNIVRAIALIDIKEEFLSLWTKYYIDSPKGQEYIKGNLNTTVQPTLNIKSLSNMPIPFYGTVYTKKAVNILSTIDNKIQLNKQINENLEQQAQALFKSWFVDFEPFKDGKFVDSELGMIPEGWQVGQISDFGKIICGKTPSKASKDFFGGNIPFIKIPDMHNQLFISHSEDSLSYKGSSSQQNKLLPPYSLLVSCIATVGLVGINTKPSHTNQQINSIVPYKSSYLFYLYLSIILMKKKLENMGRGGTATLNVNTTSFGKISLIIPKQSILDNFSSIVSPLFKNIENLSEQIFKLSQLRDTLLPRLMSGELEIKDNSYD